MTTSDLDNGATATMPNVIRNYLRAHDDHDTEATLATFGPDAVVVDDGNTADGREQIRHWLEHASREYTYERTLTGATATGPDEWLVTNNLTGNFPGGTVDLAYRFTVRDERIDRLAIAPIAE